MSKLAEDLVVLRSKDALALLLDWTAFAGAMSFISSSTILPAFVTNLTTSNVAIGLIGSIFFLGFNLPQILVSNKVEKLRRKREYVLKVTLGERVPWLLMTLVTLLMLPSNPQLVLAIFFISLCVTQFSGGASAPAWLDVVGKVIPSSSTGAFFGIANLLGSILGFVMSYVSYNYLEVFEYPVSFSACFISAFILLMISYIAFYTVREPESIPRLGGETRLGYAKDIFKLLKHDKEFRKYLIASALGGLSSMGPAFFAASAVRVAGLEREVGLLTSALMLGQVISNVIWIRLSSAKGHKHVLIVGGLMNIAACVLAMFSKNVLGFFITFMLNGASFTSFTVSGISIIYEFSPSDRRPTYFGLSSLTRAPFSTFAPIIGGMIADFHGYDPVYVLSSVFALMYVVTLLKVDTRTTNMH
jgi:MFS family permease